MDPAVEGHRLTEVVHPSGGTRLPNHLGLDGILDPGARLWVGEVEQRSMEVRILVEERRTVGLLDEIALCFRLGEKRIMTRLDAKKRVDVDEHPAQQCFVWPRQRTRISRKT